MKLYYSPGVCSLSPHIVLREAGLDAELIKVDIHAHVLEDGSDFHAINPRGYVPILVLDNGEQLSEGPAIVQYLADLAPTSKLAPAAGTMARYRLQEWLNFITSEIHKAFTPLFTPGTPEETKTTYKARLASRFSYVNDQLAGKQYLMGDDFTVADAYLFTVTRWSGNVGVDYSSLPHLVAYMDRVAARPAVQAAMKAEGLLK
jgi:glutathione S-transferase